MQYMGGKERIAKYVEEHVERNRGAATRYAEPFVGGGSVFSRVAPKFQRATASDAMPDLVLMWQALVAGWEPPSAVTREEYAALRDAEPSPLRGFVGFGCSFGGKWFGGYASDGKGRDYCGGSKRTVLRKAAGFAGTTIAHRDYRSWDFGAGDVVYCDPPYAGTTGYSGAPEKFDSAEFWRTARRWADAGAVVLVSEYAGPDDVECLWTRQTTRNLKHGTGGMPAVEKLFRVHAAPVLQLSA